MVRCELFFEEEDPTGPYGEGNVITDGRAAGGGCAIMKLIDAETGGVAGVWFIFSSEPEPVVAYFRPARPAETVAREIEITGSTRVAFACNELKLEALAEGLNRIHPDEVSLPYDAQERARRDEKITRERLEGTFDELVDALGLERA
jgi:hypothetical protein